MSKYNHQSLPLPPPSRWSRPCLPGVAFAITASTGKTRCWSIRRPTRGPRTAGTFGLTCVPSWAVARHSQRSEISTFTGGQRTLRWVLVIGRVGCLLIAVYEIIPWYQGFNVRRFWIPWSWIRVPPPLAFLWGQCLCSLWEYSTVLGFQFEAFLDAIVRRKLNLVPRSPLPAPSPVFS